MDKEKASKIAALNDEFRKSGYGLALTRGIRALPDVNGLIEEIREYKWFSERNDPYGLHDFGKIYWHDKKIFWQIDCYDQNITEFADPLSLNCQRILKVMLDKES
jgi:hypothetical protein